MGKMGVNEERSTDRMFEVNNRTTDNGTTINASIQPERSILCDKLNNLTII